jgi:hypothetical protein
MCINAYFIEGYFIIILYEILVVDLNGTIEIDVRLIS